ncbi:MAG: hypothetical protein RXO32_09225 [Thermoproteus sp.]
MGVVSERDVVRALAWKASLTAAAGEAATTTGLVYILTTRWSSPRGNGETP